MGRRQVAARRIGMAACGSGRTSHKSIVFVHQCLDVIPPFGVKNGPEVRKILEDSGKVLAVLQGHYHWGNYQEIGGLHYSPCGGGRRQRPGKQRLCHDGYFAGRRDPHYRFPKAEELWVGVGGVLAGTLQTFQQWSAANGLPSKTSPQWRGSAAEIRQSSI